MVAEVPRIKSKSRNESARIPERRPEDKAAVLFAALDVALARGEFARAAEAQRELEESGWAVKRRCPGCARRREGVAP
jgi:hypothetical protein